MIHVAFNKHDTNFFWLLLSDWNMIQPMCLTWYRCCVTPATWYNHETAKCDIYHTDVMWPLSTWYNHDTVTTDTHDTDVVWPLLSDTNMIQAMWHKWYRCWVTPFYLIQSWHCHNWHTWYRWCLTASTWYKHDTSYVTHMIQMVPNSSLPDTNMIQAMWHKWYRCCVTQFYLIQTWHCHMWHTCYRPGPIFTGR